MPPEHEGLIAEALERFGRVRFKANGTSMTPSIWPGDIVEVRSVPAALMETGDIVLVHRDSRLFAHRLVSADVLRDQFTTRGDAHDACDPSVSASSVLGVVTRVDRGPFSLDPRVTPHAGWRAANAVAHVVRRVRRQLTTSAEWVRTA